MTKSFERLISMTVLILLSGAILPMVVSEEYPMDVNTLSNSPILVGAPSFLKISPSSNGDCPFRVRAINGNALGHS